MLFENAVCFFQLNILSNELTWSGSVFIKLFCSFNLHFDMLHSGKQLLQLGESGKSLTKHLVHSTPCIGLGWVETFPRIRCTRFIMFSSRLCAFPCNSVLQDRNLTLRQNKLVRFIPVEFSTITNLPTLGNALST